MTRFNKFPANLSLGARLGLGFGGTIFLSALVLGATAGTLAQNRIEQDIGRELNHLADQMSDQLEVSMFERYREIQIIAGLEPFRNPQTPVAQQQALLDTLQTTYPSYSWIGFADTQGIVRASTQGILQGKNVAERPWFINARQTSFVGDVHEALLLAKLLPPNPNGEPLRFVDVSTPVTNAQGEWQGVLGAHLSWNWVEAVEASLVEQVGGNKEVFILSPTGTVLLGPAPWQDQELSLDSLRLAQSQQSGYVVEEWPDGKTYLTGFVQGQGYDSYPGLGWIILVREQTDTAFAPAQALYWQILGGGFFLGGGFALLGWLVAARITNPLLKIATAADQIRQGNRTASIPVLTGKTETAQLSQALHQMVANLVSQEQALKQANHELQRQLELSDRKDKSLQRSEEQLRQIVDNIQDALLLKAVNTGEVIYFNPGYAKLHQEITTGETAQDPQAWLRLIHPQDQGRVTLKMQAQYRGEGFLNEEYRLVLPDGSVRWIWDRAFPIRDEAGQVYRYAVIKRDITERKYSEAILKTLIESTASTTGQDFFSTLAQRLSEVLDVDHVFIAERIGEELRTLSFWSQGQFQPNITYRPDNTPCHVILNEGIYCFSNNVAEQFPDNEYLASLQAQGYFGVAITNVVGEVLGTLCIVSSKALDSPDRYTALLQVFAIRAAAELERQRGEAALKESEGRFRLLAENTRDLICLHRPTGHFLYLSQSCQALLGFATEELIGSTPYALMHRDDRRRIQLEVHHMMRQGNPSPITYQARRKDGQYIWLESLIKVISNEIGEVVYFQTSSRDVTDKIRVQQQLQYDATHDGLTGLSNRSLLLERLALALERAKRHSDFHFAILFIDLDRFKVINDSLGHLAGDQLLRLTARKLEKTIRPIDLAARVGGDEFVLLIEEVSGLQEAIRIAERILTCLNTPITLEKQEVVVNASIGIMMGTPDYECNLDLLRDADIAMYCAKAKGKACYAIFNPEMHTQALKQLKLENDLRRALENQEFRLHYQPIVDLSTGKLLGFEALVRWQPSVEGVVSPAEFIPIAEEIGLIVPLGSWILHEACRQMASWQSQFPEAATLKMSVNLSVQQLREADLLSLVENVLKSTGLPGRCLALEITESMLMQDVEAVSCLLEQLRSLSIQISIDDFGTGFSSLSYLHRLPVNNLKIDRSFVSNLCDSQRNLGIAETIIALANQLGIGTIAEGIETQEQLEQLDAIGCRLGQGYLFSPPVSAEAASKLVGQVGQPLVLSPLSSDENELPSASG
ncbi:MAG: EAL domain-containing protein [Cyanobacteria bacterium Co-bin8]|nr:EAL domain-containing protein [Cyanobacteria bacterium Co-bin8]